MKRLVWIALIGAAACSDANVAGNYSAAIVNRADGCSIGWNVGEETAAQVTVTQEGDTATLIVEGVPGLVVSGLLGANSFRGEVDGDDVNLTSTGTPRPNTIGGCVFTVNGEIDAVQDGDTMKGRVEYRAATNDDPSCGTRTGCLSTQDFNASRAPR